MKIKLKPHHEFPTLYPKSRPKKRLLKGHARRKNPQICGGASRTSSPALEQRFRHLVGVKEKSPILDFFSQYIQTSMF